MTFRDRDRPDVDALLVDLYLDGLLAAHDRHAQDAPRDPAVDPRLTTAAGRLRRDLVRVHPSFRFEERLAARLAELAAAARMPAAAGAEGVIIPFPGLRQRAPRPGSGPDDPQLEAIVHGRLDPSAAPEAANRPLIVGGAVASAALSLAGVAYVAWRATRTQPAPMARAARAVRSVRRGRQRWPGRGLA